jgi:hypothetical protein
MIDASRAALFASVLEGDAYLILLFLSLNIETEVLFK